MLFFTVSQAFSECKRVQRARRKGSSIPWKSDVSLSGHLILKFDPNDFITPMPGDEIESYAKQPGGISGAPVFGWHNEANFIWVGNVVEFNASLEILRVAPSERIFDRIAGCNQ